MRIVMLAAAVAGLAACDPDGPSASGEQLAAKIVDADGVLNLDEETVSSVVGAQLQGVVMQTPSITQEQAQKLEAAIRRNIEAELPTLKKEMAGFLGEAFDAGELRTYYDYVVPKNGEAIKDRVLPVTQKSLEAADAMTTKAVDKAIAEVLGSAGATPGAMADDAAAPAQPANPTKPQ